MNRQVNLWHKEHANFAKLLDILDRELATLHSGDHTDFELVRHIIYYLREYSDRYHHPREDAAMAKMLRHDPSLEVQINRLQQEHRVIAAAGEKVAEGLEQVLEDTIVARGGLEMALAVYITFYRHHMNTEEAKIIPLAGTLLTRADWDAVNAVAPAELDPLFSESTHARFEVLRQQLMA